jgi:hypothetical protein
MTAQSLENRIHVVILCTKHVKEKEDGKREILPENLLELHDS